MNIPTYPSAITFLYGLRLFGLKLGLTNTFKLAALAGNPHAQLRFIHVAGTNGKGSTCAMLESIYRRAGLRAGLFTSPHLVSFRERIQVNRQFISETDVVRLVRQIQGLLKEFSAEHHPTFFEVLTVLALRYFAEQKCDVVIWETGLGGRLDATNIVTPLASVITNVQFDHQNWLGNTRAEIAAEKAGIIKHGVPVVTATDAPEALEVIRETARKFSAPLTIVAVPETAPRAGGEHTIGQPAFPVPLLRGISSGLPDNFSLPLLGEHQRLNAALAIATVEGLQHQIPVSAGAIRTGLESVHWPGRLQLVNTASGQTILLDGAHNPASAVALREALDSEHVRALIFTRRQGTARIPSPEAATGTLILGTLADKDWPRMCAILAPLAGRVLLTPVGSERTAAPEELRAACAQANPNADTMACPSLADALQHAANDAFVIITGSLYLVGEAMELLGISPATLASERGLNEWMLKK